ncbi:MAG TPA: M56 family metallopeptidase [Pyrinomonadaceae bacterium]|jgi:beta-lactamase regulating signal transducer with metallopeptidase domain|nr:M56 family metallopeptidase [Pyrinomonadaceae bacterium]
MSILFRQLDFAPRLIAEALLNSLWQGALLALLIWLLLRLCGRKANAATRYSIWSATLLAVVCLPFLDAFTSSRAGETASLSSPVNRPFESSHASSPVATRNAPELPVMNSTVTNSTVMNWTSAGPRASGFENGEMMVQTNAEGSLIPNAEGSLINAPRGFAVPVEMTAESRTAREGFRLRLRDDGWSRVFLILWMLGVAAMLARLARSYLSLRRHKRTSEPLAGDYQERLGHWLKTCAIGRRVSLRGSEKINVPLMLGLRETVILFPERLASELASDEFDQVLLHELAHARRRDDWTNLLQKLFEACFFFHPVVWWTGRQLNAEREMACDQWVVNVTGAYRSYASCLTRLFELTETPRAPLLAPGAWRLKSHLARRIETILKHQRGIAPHLSTRRLIIPLCLLCAMLIQFVRIPPVIAVSVGANDAFKITEEHDEFNDTHAGAQRAHTARPAMTQDTSQQEPLQPEASQQETSQESDASEALNFSVNHRGLPLHDAPFELAERAGNITPQLMRPVAFVSQRSGNPPTEISNGASQPVRDQPSTAQGASAQEMVSSSGVVVPTGFFRTVAAMDSPASQREVLTALLKTGEPSREFLVQALTVARNMDSDGEKAEFLIYAARFCSAEAAVLNAFLGAVESIKSAGEERRTLAALLKLKGQDGVILSRALRTAATIDSDGEKAELLVMAARLYAIDNASLPAFLNAVSTISSAAERRRALTAALRLGSPRTEVLAQLVRFARNLNSDGEKAEFLVRVSEVCPGSEALLAAYVATAVTLNSAEEQRRALAAMSNMSKKKVIGQGVQTHTRLLARNGVVAQ